MDIIYWKYALLAGGGLALGTVIGYLINRLLILQQKSSAELKIKQALLDAKTKAQATIDEAKEKADQILESAKQEEKTAMTQVRRLEERIIKREEQIEKNQTDIAKEQDLLKQKVEFLNKKKEEMEEIEAKKLTELERVASLTEEEAKEEIMKTIEKKNEEDFMVRMQKLEIFGREEIEKKAKDILATAIQRLASSTASEITTSTISIPSDDIKGKIIGKEGRNIRAIERATGTEIIVDDTPESIVISSFDPIRRQIAKLTLEGLIADGRIQPARIEEMAEKAKAEIEKTVKQKGETAAYEAGVLDLDPRLLTILGRLFFRTSYGQNVLQHSVESAHFAGMLAAEIGADVQVAKKAALLHDIGKAMDHEVQGTHVDIGKRILEKFSMNEKVIKAMQAHHEEYPYETLEAVIVQVADAISSSRPGARRDSLENYIKRLEDLEKIANSFHGVEKSYAIQAGREIRIFVTPDKVTDLEAKNMAREVANKIEQDLKYPGEIKVTVIRENRVIEFAR